ncbi:DUF3850 domain-containing protein [Paenibacillus radicis (ex Xue et al. 2023)]|uniref:DUF3850 domain-containing protein n=1 Tax=Paenibacillus radicis (ex Xue et al. 2023) TaxID=2972489 RepID=A0ABT1YCE8_9BACL|nr:DUF3850 domain-containing protein [Paenibacillus radicis (ex Xue et al. 2023)]MCR8630874.1 DUF3850 domain-containing protein [Paenibacillus radicis (ex Xue et al. 2023)]
MVEIRKGDRGYAVGDILVLKEYSPDEKRYTGREAIVKVSHCVITHYVTGKEVGRN